MTDNEIIRSLECCANDGDCKDCKINPHKGNYGYCISLAIKAAIDLINRQKAEIENKDRQIGELVSFQRFCEAKAIKEFAERLAVELTGWETDPTDEEIELTINNLVKEMKEGKQQT